MSQHTAIITGATGQLGRQCMKAFKAAGWNTVGTGFSRATGEIRKLDLGDQEQVRMLIAEVRPRVLIHTAAERAPDKCANDPTGTQRLNVHATQYLAETCQAHDVVLIYISTDYVFSGAPGEAPYSHDSLTSPPNFYGETKLAGETIVRSHGGVVFRVPVLYGETEFMGESAVNTLMDVVWNKAGKKEIEMDDWSIRYPTNTEDVARVLKDVADIYKQGRGSLPEILQFSAEERFTKYQICKIFAEVMGLPHQHIKGNAENDPNSTVVRPYDCHLSTQALRDLGIDVSATPFKIWWQKYMGAYKK
ncbi:hypothetical protein BZA77DRAFT_270665 [Pyronema omphalodes]|nr:hypothetical protein BZA77DRAFT_270665 [Pyronema omphalodes]